MELYNSIEEVFSVFVNYGILVLEFIGVMVLLVTALKSVKGIIKREEHVRLDLAQGIALVVANRHLDAQRRGAGAHQFDGLRVALFGDKESVTHSVALSLEFKLGGEVLRTVIVRTKSELVVLGAIIVLRGILTFLIQWEIKNEEARIAELRKKRESSEIK